MDPSLTDLSPTYHLGSRIHSFHQEEPPLLAELQSEHWVPLLEWARSTFDVEIQTSESILLSEQPEETKRKLGAVLDTFDPWEMAGSYTSLHIGMPGS